MRPKLSFKRLKNPMLDKVLDDLSESEKGEGTDGPISERSEDPERTGDDNGDSAMEEGSGINDESGMTEEERKATKALRMRKKVVEELVSTEKSYVEFLAAIQQRISSYLYKKMHKPQKNQFFLKIAKKRFSLIGLLC